MTPQDRATVDELLIYLQQFEPEGKTFNEFWAGWKLIAGDMDVRAFAADVEQELHDRYTGALDCAGAWGYVERTEWSDQFILPDERDRTAEWIA